MLSPIEARIAELHAKYDRGVFHVSTFLRENLGTEDEVRAELEKLVAAGKLRPHELHYSADGEVLWAGAPGTEPVDLDEPVDYTEVHYVLVRPYTPTSG